MTSPASVPLLGTWRPSTNPSKESETNALRMNELIELYKTRQKVLQRSSGIFCALTCWCAFCCCCCPSANAPTRRSDFLCVALNPWTCCCDEEMREGWGLPTQDKVFWLPPEREEMTMRVKNAAKFSLTSSFSPFLEGVQNNRAILDITLEYMGREDLRNAIFSQAIDSGSQTLIDIYEREL